MARAGHDVVVLASSAQDTVLDGVRIRSLSQPSFRLMRFLSAITVVLAVLKERADVYHFHDPELIPAALLLRLLGKKVVYDAHEDLPRDILSKHYLPRWLRPTLSAIMDPLERWAGRRMSAVITATNGIAKRFPGAVVLRNYPVLAHSKLAQQKSSHGGDSGHFLVYFGTINRLVGIKEMAAAVSSVSREYPVKLRLLGEFDDDALRLEILGSGEEGVVDYRGFVPMPDVYRYYRGALAGLLVLHPIGKLRESMPIKMFECMACGIPVIASDFPLWREVLHKNGCGVMVDPLNVNEIADAIRYLIRHPKEARRMGQRGVSLVERRYNWESESDKLLSLYERLLSDPPKRGS